jgi:hypothetical protein
MKNPLSVYVETVFSFGQIPNTMATKKNNPVQSVQRVFQEQKSAQIAIF